MLVCAQALAEIKHEKRDTNFYMRLPIMDKNAELMNERVRFISLLLKLHGVKPCWPAFPTGCTPHLALLCTQCALHVAAYNCGLLPALKKSQERSHWG